MKTLEEILAYRGPAEQELDVKSSMRTLVLLQEYPDLTLISTTGIVLPPHERAMLYAMHWGAQSTVIVASRGTSKSSTACVLYPNYKAAVFPRRAIIELSATGFRGGQMLFSDAARWLSGGWDSQDPEAKLLRAGIPRQQLLNRSQNWWSIEYESHSRLVTLPTKNPDDIRGHRANDVFVDEANYVERDLIDKVVLPFLNVKGDFRHGGAFAQSNQVYFVSTIDYTYRPFQDRIRAARDGIARDKAAVEAAARGDLERYEEITAAGSCEHQYVRYDYTDLLIRRQVTTRSGLIYEVSWPNPDIPLSHDPRGIPFVERDATGMLKRGSPMEYYSTYPMDKQGLERPLLDGSTDESSWLAEQRNIVDAAMGDVYSHDLVDRASCKGEYAIIPYAQCGDAWKTACGEVERDYTGPVLWRCSDPCVLGVDYAPLSDFCAFVVMRIGPCATGTFDPMTHHGKTTWSNVIWAEQHRMMSYRQVADKIREFIGRYNLVWHDEPHKTDPWECCRAIGLDMRGGGNGVRDELAYINDETLPTGSYRIYDRFDQDERIVAFQSDPSVKPMLDAIWPSDQLNDKLVEFTVGQMQQNLLFIPKYLPLSDRPRGKRELHIAYDASLSLDGQLRKLRQAPTKNWRTFYMEGDTVQDQNKKDLWAAYIYAARQLRAHIIRQRQLDSTPPPTGARVVKVWGGRGPYGKPGRNAGSRD